MKNDWQNKNSYEAMLYLRNCLVICLSVFISMFLFGVLLAVISLHLVYLVDVEGAQGNSDDEAQPAVVEEVVTCHACD